MSAFRLRVLAQTLPFLLLAPGLALAQAAPTRAEATAALLPSAPLYAPRQLDQMLAPIALYPDRLLGDVLMAATYPQQLVDAAQWLQDPAHAALKGDALVGALQPLPWDPSVKALAAFPQVIVMMTDHIDWTEALGAAFAGQQAEVMARVQFLRGQALSAGKIANAQHLHIEREGQTIIIEPAEPDLVYVPFYNPAVVYGAWPDRDYPPVYLPPPPGFVEGPTAVIAAGLGFSIGYAVAQPLWSWSRPDWRDNRIAIDQSEYSHISRDAAPPSAAWRHEGPVAGIAARPGRPPAAAGAPHPSGTVSPAAVARLPAASEPPHGPGNAGVHLPGAPPAHEPENAGAHSLPTPQPPRGPENTGMRPLPGTQRLLVPESSGMHPSPGPQPSHGPEPPGIRPPPELQSPHGPENPGMHPSPGPPPAHGPENAGVHPPPGSPAILRGGNGPAAEPHPAAIPPAHQPGPPPGGPHPPGPAPAGHSPAPPHPEGRPGEPEPHEH